MKLATCLSLKGLEYEEYRIALWLNKMSFKYNQQLPVEEFWEQSSLLLTNCKKRLEYGR